MLLCAASSMCPQPLSGLCIFSHWWALLHLWWTVVVQRFPFSAADQSNTQPVKEHSHKNKCSHFKWGKVHLNPQTKLWVNNIFLYSHSYLKVPHMKKDAWANRWNRFSSFTFPYVTTQATATYRSSISIHAFRVANCLVQCIIVYYYHCIMYSQSSQLNDKILSTSLLWAISMCWLLPKLLKTFAG